ncbi:MAG TPA: ABC transporter substrate-binding protein [Petrotogaceae bacterium]|nr:ABC transporter substrate-binding protein [Petrotogaceae bacterium]
MKILFFLITLWLVSVPLYADKSDSYGKDLYSIKLQLKWYHQFQFAGYYAALEKGFYEQAGLDVSIIEGGPDIFPVAAVYNKEAQYGVCGSELLLHRLRGYPLVLLANIFQHSPLVLMVMGNSDIYSPIDLIDKRILLHEDGSDAEIGAMLMSEGVNPQSYGYYDGSADTDMLLEGKIDALAVYITNEPYILKSMGTDIRVINPLKYGIDFYGDCLFTTEDEINNYPLRVRAFRQASIKGWEYALNNIDEIALLIKEKYRSDADIDMLRYEGSTIRDSFIMNKEVELGHTNQGRWEEIGKTYRRLGMTASSSRMEGFFAWEYENNESPEKLPSKLLPYMGIGILSLLAGGTLFFHIKLKVYTKNKIHSLQKFFSLPSYMLLVMDYSGKIKECNQAWVLWMKRYFGSEHPENIRQVLTGEDVGKIEKFCQTNDPLQSSISLEVCFKTAESSGWIALDFYLAFDEKLLYAIARDITEEKARNGRMNESVEKALENARKKTDFIASMSHEIRTPMNAMVSITQMLIESGLNIEQKDIAEILIVSQHNLLQIINEIIDFSKLEAGRDEVILDSFSIKEQAKSIYQLFEVMARQKKIDFKINLIRPLPNFIISDSQKIRQICINLISNAFKYTEKGEIIFSVGMTEPGILKISVQDTGIGISNEDISRIFNFYSRIERKGTVRQSGTGLGLVISQKYARAMGGSVTVESQYSKGSIFTLTVPVHVIN